ncbi:MAG: apolipoprotein N-acyltransferase [Alphaproteobacteria bacterium]|nr:apolipoprotein N-acyltransferase [Alphaproteobacteria bacterium]
MKRIESFAEKVRGLDLWHHRIVAFFCGIISVAALPPYHFIPALFSIPVLIWLVDGVKTRRSAFSTGWWFGLGHFALGMSWTANALTVDIVRFGWLIPFCILGFGAVLGVYIGLTTLVAFFAKTGIRRAVIFAAAWTLFEWLRSWVFTGLPWNLTGTVWANSESIMQVCSFAGIYGLSLATILFFAMFSIFGDKACNRKYFAVGISSLFIILIAVGGMLRLSYASDDFVSNVKLRLVQANILQKDKWDSSRRGYNLLEHIALSRSKGFEEITHVIWSETASSFPLNIDFYAKTATAKAVPLNGALITGTPRFDMHGKKAKRIWNSIIAIDEAGNTLAYYDKAHLVPFGEYVPFGKYLPLDKITSGKLDFSSGDGLKTLEIKGLPPFSPLVCYEVIFPTEVIGKEKRPSWLLNVTNDGWYGDSAGPYQHFVASRFRAIEEGIPLVRVANTGISGVIDAYGRVVSSLPLGKKGVIDSKLPKALEKITFYGRFGNGIPLTLIFLLFLGGFSNRIRSKYNAEYVSL